MTGRPNSEIAQRVAAERRIDTCVALLSELEQLAHYMEVVVSAHALTSSTAFESKILKDAHDVAKKRLSPVFQTLSVVSPGLLVELQKPFDDFESATLLSIRFDPAGPEQAETAIATIRRLIQEHLGTA